ncbi:hypothetical protein PGT21_037129 [Puccinia graminis f. sp. tritici]|uniref:Uncharacterized protein n=1 Tax=Puccinia graminis f. sp. tritici TaxID=56615 RepID=A0A5B0R3Q6_PUCGR|nr:hypothetical protein PGT21_037129 [Puccinia graminis f. sp. tritici]
MVPRLGHSPCPKCHINAGVGADSAFVYRWPAVDMLGLIELGTRASRDGGVQTEYAPVALYQGVLRPCCQGAVAPQLGLGHRPHREVADWVGLRPADVQVIRSRFGGRSAPARYCEVLRLPQGKAQVASAEAQAGVIAPHRNAGASQAQVGGSDRAATGRRGGQMSIGGEHCV